MTKNEIFKLMTDSTTASLGFLDEAGNPSIRCVFCTWHKGMGSHLISTNTSSMHVQQLLKSNQACLYFNNCETFEGICLSGKGIVHQDHEFREKLWHDQDVMYYPNGVDDEDYCVIEFIADSGRYYRFDGKGDLTKQDFEQFDKGYEYKDYSD